MVRKSLRPRILFRSPGGMLVCQHHAKGAKPPLERLRHEEAVAIEQATAHRIGCDVCAIERRSRVASC